MRLAHLSDLHFGSRVSLEHVEALGADIVTQRPDLLVLTGDLTDRGRSAQFRWAKAFLDSLGVPAIGVPGNREVAVTSFWEVLAPRLAMARYRRFFGPSDRVGHVCEASRVALFGINSVHRLPSWPGAVRRETRHWLREQAARLNGYLKILFLHHPVVPVIRSSSFWAHTLSDAGELLNICTETGICLILQGHKHRSSVVELRVPQRNANVVVSAAGAPLMKRWDPTYHVIELSDSTIVVACREFRDGRFEHVTKYRFSIRPDGPGSDVPGP